MKDEHDDFPPRLLASASDAQRALLDAAKLEAPDDEARDLGMQRVLERRAAEQRAAVRRRSAALGVLGLAAAAVLYWRVKTPTPVLAVGEPQASVSSSSRLSPPSPLSLPSDDPLAPCAPAVVAAGREPLIDDFEDGDTRLPRIEKRGGFWVAFNDGTGVQRPRPGTLFTPDKIPGGRGSSLLGLHVTGTKFSKWGAAVSAQLSHRICYDASAYAGVQFWARGRGEIDVSVLMTQVVSEEYGGSCIGECDDSHFVTVKLEKQWTLHRVRWEELSQKNESPRIPFDAHSLFSVVFGTKTKQTPFDYWLDDVSFLPR